MNQRVIRITKARITATPPASFMKQRVIRFPKARPRVPPVMPPMKPRYIKGITAVTCPAYRIYHALIHQVRDPRGSAAEAEAVYNAFIRDWNVLLEARRSRRCCRRV
jgi:hypothetical protein